MRTDDGCRVDGGTGLPSANVRRRLRGRIASGARSNAETTARTLGQGFGVGRGAPAPHPRPAEARVHSRREAAAAIESTDRRAVLRWRLMLAPRHRIGALLVALCLALLGATSAFARAPGPITSKGAFKLVTYNIAGFPEGISRSRPRTNIPLIAPLLADYDIALVQEDFAYQSLLRAGVPH